MEAQDKELVTLKRDIVKNQEKQSDNFNPDVTIVVTNPCGQAVYSPEEYGRMLIKAIGRPVTVVKVMQTTQRGNSKGVLKIQLSSKEEKIDVLRHKTNLKNSSTFSNVYIRSSKTHTERLIDLNFKTLISDLIPEAATGYRITGSGKLIKKIPNDGTQPNARTQMEDNIHLLQKSHGLPPMQAAEHPATVCNPVLLPAAAIQQVQVQPGNLPIRTPQTQPTTHFCQPHPWEQCQEVISQVI